MAKSCFFIGHSEASDEIRPALVDAIQRHITEYGVTEFIVGGYGGFDRLVQSVLQEIKVIFPYIENILLLTYHPAERPITPPESFISYYPFEGENIPRRFAIVRANKRIIDQVDFLIAYVWHPSGGSSKLLDYARKRENKGRIKVENLADVLRNKYVGCNCVEKQYNWK